MPENEIGWKIGKRWVLGNGFFLQFWYLESNHTICQHAVLRPFRFLELSVFFQSSLPSIFPHFYSFTDIPLMYSRDMKPTSKTSIETQVPGRDFWNTENKNQWNRNGGDCTMDNNLKGLRSNSTIVIQNSIGETQLGRQTFRIKNYKRILIRWP